MKKNHNQLSHQNEEEGRRSKIDEEAPMHEAPQPQPQPLSPIQERPAPKKRGRPPQKVQAREESKPPENAPPKRTRRTKAAVPAADLQGVPLPEAEVSEPVEDLSPSSPKKRGRRQAPVPAGPSLISNPSPAKATTPREDDDSSEDELLLTTSKPANARLTTPSRTGAPNGGGTPRMFLHCVEILTPRRMLASARRDHASPERGSPGLRQPAIAYIPPAGTPRLPAPFLSAGGSPSKRPPPPPSAGRRLAARTPSPGPLAPRLPGLQPPESPSRAARRPVPASPSKAKGKQREQPTDELPRVLPEHLHRLLERQKGAILRSLQRPPEIDEIEVYGEDYPPTNNAAHEQLSDLLQGTVVRGEGNSCLLIGPSGSGKTQLVERAIAELPSKPIVVRLSGHAQHNDRLAIREIAWQLAQQTGQSFLPNDSEDAEDEEPGPPAPAEHEHAVDPEADADHDADVDAEIDEDENPFLDSARAPVPALDSVAPTIALPPPAHLLALISMIPTLPRPTIIILDGFDLFATHARQALLYCLLDTAQACRTGTGSGSGMAVVGVTARVDTINLLEKRVKSRFSGRMIRTACPAKIEHWVELAKATLSAPVVSESTKGSADEKEWVRVWAKAVENFAGSEDVVEAFKETYALTRDYQMFRRIMTQTRLTLELNTSSPYPTVAKLDSATKTQRCPPRLPALETLPYPAVCLLIASVHASTSGHDTFTFEMLHDAFKTQVRTSQSAPVQVAGGGVGMAFERLVELRVFLPAAAPAASIAKEFALHRSAVDRFEVRRTVDAIGQLSLKKWFTKA
uniref:Origin recognition complex subunit 4 n=1 Tax=Ganoderma boninense TaxID=34458 RepID=A0A5K1K5K4_9APHY|nr:Ras GTPase activator [Ganoderma boninense]